MSYPTYPHLENLDRVPYVLEAAEVWVTEKIHGFNARFGHTPDGVFWVGSRNQTVESGLQGFVDWARSREAFGVSGYTFIGEWAGKGIQKGIDYGERDFYLFAVMWNGELCPPADVEDWADRLECRMVPVLHWGPTPTLAELEAMRTSPSMVAHGSDKEGIVISPWPPVLDPYGHRVIAKWKNEGFEERAKQPRPDRPPLDLASVTAFVEQYATATRLEHVLDQVQEVQQHLTVEQVATDNRLMGDILRAYYFDVTREGWEDFEALPEDDRKMVGKVLNKYVKDLLSAYRAGLLSSSVGTSHDAEVA